MGDSRYRPSDSLAPPLDEAEMGARTQAAWS